MSSVTVCTSFSSEGFSQYGKRMLLSAITNLPANCRIVVYVNKEFPQFHSPRVEFIDSYAIEDGVADFVKKYSRFPKYCGYNPNFNRGQYNFRWDAIKFCHKVFAIEHCSRHCQSDLLCWLDADSFIFDVIPEGWLESLLPEPYYLSFLGRPAYSHSDCSFMAFRQNALVNQEFMSRYLGIYKSGRFEQEKESHDSFLFDLVRKEMESEGKIKSFNLSKEEKGHTFISSELGRFMDTLKGKRKITGSSWREDLSMKRDEPYWKSLPLRNN